MNNPTNTSHGQTLMRSLILRQLNASFVENHRPDWLLGMELDFYFEGLKLAIEFQGGQHYTPCFGMAAMHAQKKRDTAKKRICKERGILLLRLEASDLVVSRFRGLMNWHGFKAHLFEARKAKGFNKQGVKYRETLRNNFQCPTAHRKGSAPRKAAMVSAFSPDR
jgi:very-short-patch-repair endonuclease